MMNLKSLLSKATSFIQFIIFFKGNTWVELKRQTISSELKAKSQSKGIDVGKLTDEWCPIYLPVSLLNRIWFRNKLELLMFKNILVPCNMINPTVLQRLFQQFFYLIKKNCQSWRFEAYQTDMYGTTVSGIVTGLEKLRFTVKAVRVGIESYLRNWHFLPSYR